MVKVLLADNHAIMRDVILEMLTHDSRINVLGDAGDFCEAITEANKFRPEVLIVDLHMPVKSGVSSSDLNGELNSCGAKVLGISFSYDDDAKSLARSMGAVELLDKVNLGKELIPAILRLASVRDSAPPVFATPAYVSELQ
jgi:chemotaxis response regulator CheB